MLMMRRVLVWLLALALPMLGHAALATLDCCLQPAHETAPFANAQGHARQHHHLIAAQELQPDAQDPHGGPPVHGEATRITLDDESTVQCSACAEGCAGSVAVPAIGTTLPARQAPFARTGWLAPAPAQGLGARLERPPKAL